MENLSRQDSNNSREMNDVFSWALRRRLFQTQIDHLFQQVGQYNIGVLLVQTIHDEQDHHQQIKEVEFEEGFINRNIMFD